MIAISMLFLASCRLGELSRPPLGLGGVVAKVGKFTDNEVNDVRASVAAMLFPAEEGSAASVLPRGVVPLTVRFSDAAPDKEGKGRTGGKVVEYWLNEGFVLQVASAYYKVGERTFTKEEWAVVLTRSERDRIGRPIYPGDLGMMYVDN